MNVIGSSSVSSPQQGSYAPKTDVSAPVSSTPEVSKATESVSTNVPKTDTNEKKEDGQGRPEASQEAIRKAVADINKHAKGTEAVFGIHEATNRVTIKIVDKESKDVIKELPAEKTLDLIAKAWEMAGLLVDEKR